MVTFIVLLFFVYQYSTQETPHSSSSSEQPDVCKVWKNSPNANFSYYVQIQDDSNLYFCGGILVQKNWVLTSYSCFLRIVDYAKDPYRDNIQSLNISQLNIQKFNNNNKNDDCFQILELENTKIRIKTTVDNCVDGSADINFGSMTVPLFGVINNNYQTKQIKFNKNNVTVHINDFLLLKLRDNFYDVPLDDVKLLPFEFQNQKIKYEILLQVQNDNNFLLEMGQTEVFPGINNNFNNFDSQNSFECYQNFTDVVCSQSQEICEQQKYICGEFIIPELDKFSSFQVHSGDPLVRQKNSTGADIYGFLSLDFLQQNYRRYFLENQEISKYFYSHNSGNYSFDSNGAIFVSLTPQIIEWVKATIDQYIKDDCTKNNQQQQNIFFVLIAIIILMVAVIAVLISRHFKICSFKFRIFNFWKKKLPNNQYIELQPLQLQQLESGGLAVNSAISNSDLRIVGEMQSVVTPLSLPSSTLSELYVFQNVPEISIYKDMQISWEDCLGSGSYGKVYKGKVTRQGKEQKGLNTQYVAVKELTKAYKTKEELKDILEEVSIMSKLNNEFIVQLYGVGPYVHPCIIMEYLPHGSLDDLFKSQKYETYKKSLIWMLELFIKITKGVEYLHSRNIVHHDLKPTNILVDFPDEHSDIITIKVSDFGLSKIKEDGKSSVGGDAGTKNYMAPEQFFNKRSKSIDVWALACIMQECLTGEEPWQGKTRAEIVHLMTIKKSSPELKNLQENCGKDELYQLILKCWNFNKSERPTASEIVVELENIKNVVQNLNSN